MSDIYYQPRRTQYKSQYVPMPLDFMQKALGAKQAKWDATQLAMDELSDKEFKALQGEDTKKAQAVKKKIDDFVDTSIGKDIGSSEFDREFKKIVREIKNDKDLTTVQSAYAQQQELQKMKDDWIAEGKTLESMPEVWYEADRRLKEYTQGKGYLGDVRLLDIGDIRPGVDVRGETSKWFDDLAKESSGQPLGSEWGITFDKLVGSAKSLFDGWLSAPEGQQYLRRYDAQQEQWSGSLANMSRKKEVLLDAQGNNTKDQEGNDIMLSEYDRYQMNKKQDAYNFFRNIGEQRVGVKVNTSDNDTNTGTTFGVGTDGGHNLAGQGFVTPQEQLSDDVEMLRAENDLKRQIKELEEIPEDERTLQDDDNLEKSKELLNDLTHKNNNLRVRNEQTTENFAVENKLVSSKKDYEETRNNNNNVLLNGKHKDEINEDLNRSLTPEEQLEYYNNVVAELDNMLASSPASGLFFNQEKRSEINKRLKNQINQDYEGGKMASLTGVIDAVENLQTAANYVGLGWWSEMGSKVMYEVQKGKIAEYMATEENDGKSIVKNKSNLLNAYFDADNYTYPENTEMEYFNKTNPSRQIAKDKESVWATNPILVRMKRIGLPENREDGKDALDIFIKKLDDFTNTEDKGLEAISAVSSLYDVKGDLSWSELEEKKNEYDQVAKNVRLDRKIYAKKYKRSAAGKIAREGDEGLKHTDEWKDAFNRTVVGTSVDNMETLYAGEKDAMNNWIKPSVILETTNVRDGNGDLMTKAKILAKYTPQGAKNAQLTLKNTSWDYRYNDRDEDGNFRYKIQLNGTIDYEDDENKRRSSSFTSDPYTLSTANAVDPNKIKRKIVGLKRKQIEEADKQYITRMQAATSNGARLDAIEEKISTENENILEISKLNDPPFYRYMNNITKTFKTGGYYKKDKNNNVIDWTVPQITINRVTNEGTSEESSLATDTFKIVQTGGEGKERDTYMIEFTSKVGNDEVNDTKGPFLDYRHALNVIYNYRLESEEAESSAILGADTEDLDSLELFDELSEKVDID